MVAILAAPPEEQMEYLLTGEPSLPVDELYQQFDDSVPSWFPRLRRYGLINEAIEDALMKLLAALERLRDAKDPTLWEDDALFSRPEWASIRSIAASALDAMGPAKPLCTSH